MCGVGQRRGIGLELPIGVRLWCRHRESGERERRVVCRAVRTGEERRCRLEEANVSEEFGRGRVEEQRKKRGSGSVFNDVWGRSIEALSQDLSRNRGMRLKRRRATGFYGISARIRPDLGTL
ncbi:hypothetical protein KFK09_022787 [Dendrobium nobile]|uniref:Uncharacterized protein n=1 Tax=Dendrobium nobile TaxID=94219 RepID=A0A8T3AK36_DENNO|nr:hypothetical protein KFK09_022787 [Dendrobium nobile]